MRKALALLLCFGMILPIASAQTSSHTAFRIRFGAALPATCNPNTGDVFFKTTATIGAYQCLVLNTWTGLGGSAFASGGVTAGVIPESNGSSQLVDSPFLSPSANIVQQANTTNPQTFQLYGTTDSNTAPVNYERLIVKAVAANSFAIQSEKGGTGSLRGLDILVGLNNNLGVGASGRTFIVAGTPGTVTLYGGLNTAGHGLEAVRAAARSTGQVAAVASVATYTPTLDSSFIVSANVLVTTATTHSFTVTCTYTDEGNTARTITLPFVLVAGSAITNTVVNTNGAVPYLGVPVQIRVKASTPITIATVGTFTTVAYNVEGSIRQVN